jgi:hypothetical protein
LQIRENTIDKAVSQGRIKLIEVTGEDQNEGNEGGIDMLTNKQI